MSKYYFSARGWEMGNAVLVKKATRISVVYEVCTKAAACNDWHVGAHALPSDAVQITKCQARKYLKSWKSILELPS